MLDWLRRKRMAWNKPIGPDVEGYTAPSKSGSTENAGTRPRTVNLEADKKKKRATTTKKKSTSNDK